MQEQPLYDKSKTNIPDDEDFSIKLQFRQLFVSIKHTAVHWRILLFCALIGAGLSVSYALLRPVSYTARISFVVEESKLGGSGGLASALSGSLGLDIGSLAGGASNGVLSGDNVLELLKSHSLIRKTLFTAYDSSGKNLADIYSETYHWKEKWANSRKVGRMISFKPVQGRLGRTEDSLIQVIIKKITENDLSITKPDRKLGFFELIVSMRDEQLSLLFCERLLKTATDFYIETKTKRQVNNVRRLQAKADSLSSALNRKTYSAADANRLLLDANPVYAAPEVSAEISSRDKIMQGTVYAEIVKNLEISKTALIQETPTVQIVDDPEVPLRDDKIHLSTAILGGGILFAFLGGVCIVLFKKS
jgi:hypothetical protein